MEYVPGYNLEQMIKCESTTGYRLKFKDIATIAKHVLKGLEYLHSKT